MRRAKTVEGKVYFFGGNLSTTVDAGPEDVGSKAHSLMRMSMNGLPVPAGFVLSTQFCQQYLARGRKLPKGITELLSSNVRRLENTIRRTFGDTRRPLLLSVRSGAAVSMPGMMETILNIGLCDNTLRGMLRMTGNPRLAWDSYRRLVQAFGEVVHGTPSDPFDETLEGYLSEEEAPTAHELDARALEGLTKDYLDLFITLTGGPFPQRPIDQLVQALEAVFGSWESPRAVEFRRLHDIDDRLGTAVVVQSMVFGNMGGTSGSGVAFTRDPATGEDKLYLDFMFNAQGEDIVSGRQTLTDPGGLRRVLPGVYREIHKIRRRLESEFKDVQDFEFTIQDGELFLLQSRTAKRTPWAALRIASDLVKEGLIDKAQALRMLKGIDIETVERLRLSSKKAMEPLCTAIPAGPGVAVGEIVLDSEKVKEWASEGRSVILVREDTSTSDIAGLALSEGILTASGGRTSHAAVVARQLNKVCLVGCSSLTIDIGRRKLSLGANEFSEGEYLSLDGNNGKIYEGRSEVVVERPTKEIQDIRSWKT